MNIKSTPIARAFASRNNVDITKVVGSGFDGRILLEDVKNYKSKPPKLQTKETTTTPIQTIQQQQPPQPQKPVFISQPHSQPLAPIRKAIAKAMTNSWSNVAYTNLVNEINMTKLWKIRSSIKDLVLKSENVKLTFLPYIIKAVAIALKEFPKFTAKYNQTNSTLDYPGVINVGIAVDTEFGLMVPVIKNAVSLNLLEIATEVTRLANAARKRTIKPDEMKDGVFTITNFGSVGSLFGVPVINYPELAIAGVGAIIDRAIVENGNVVPGKVMYLTVAADHRWIDGAEVGRFAYRIKELLEQPEVLGVY